MKKNFSGKVHKIFGTMTEMHYMFSTKKEKSFITISTATKILLIFLLFIFSVNLIQALDFTVLYPNEMEKDTEFTVKIDASAQENYDVKIFVQDDTVEFSEIYGGSKWRSPFNYIISVFPSQKEFLIKSHYAGETNLCVKLRKSTDKADVSETCQPIKITDSQGEQEHEEEDEDQNKEDQEDEQAEDDETNENNQGIKDEGKNLAVKEQSQEFLSSNSTNQKERIVLNSPKPAQIQTDEYNVFRTKQDKIRMGIIYAFAVFCVFIIILLALRKL